MGDSFSGRRERTTAVLVLEVRGSWPRSDRRRALLAMAVRVDRAAVDEADGAVRPSMRHLRLSLASTRVTTKAFPADASALATTERFFRRTAIGVRVAPDGDDAALVRLWARRREVAAVAVAIAVRVVLFRLGVLFLVSIFRLDVWWAIRPAGLTALQL
jgi:hypothetical protein